MNNLNLGMWKKLMGAFLLALLGIDRLIKYWAVTYLKPIGEIVIIPDVFSLTYKESSAGAFGLMIEAMGYASLIMAAMMIFLFIHILEFSENRRKYFSISFSLLFTGVLGNMIDILDVGGIIGCFDIKGYVIPPEFRGVRIPPIFCFADLIAIAGLLIFIIYGLIVSKRGRHTRTNKLWGGEGIGVEGYDPRKFDD